MSSADSGRYQSRIFNFVHQQAQRFTQKCDRAWRQVQFTTSGLASILMYPLYLLLHSTRSPGNQFYPAGNPSQAQLTENRDSSPPPTADTPIQRVLQLVDRLPPEATSSNPVTTEALNLAKVFAALRFQLFPSHPNTPSADKNQALGEIGNSSLATAPEIPHLRSQRPNIRGIATQLDSRTLVLVTVQNEILDVLTPQQQAKITERIIVEVATYWQYQRLAHAVPRLSVRQKLLAANRLKATVARNRLRENSLPPSTTPLNINPASAWGFLDSKVAELETTHLAPVSKAAVTLSQRSWEIIQRLQTQFGISLSQKSTTVVTPDGVKTQPLGISNIIWAAVDYFFGDHGRKFLHQPAPSTVRTAGLPINPSPQVSKAKLPQSLSNNEADPWLTLTDLFGDSTETAKPTATQSGFANSVAEKSQLTLPNNSVARSSLRRFFYSCQQFLWQSPKRSSKSLEPVKRSPARSQLTQSKSNSEIAQPSHPYSTQMQPAPDWIEINATTMGYVKHPLEQVLEWLDQVMLWLEEVLLKIWQWLKKLLP